MKLWRTWLGILGHKEPATAVALFRIGLGLALLVAFGTLAFDGVIDAIWVDKAAGDGYRTVGGTWLIRELGGATPTVVWSVWAAAMLSGVLLVVGAGGRLTAFIALHLFMSLADLNGQAGGSYDELMANGLWLAVLAPSTATLSVDCRLRTGAWRSDRSVAAWPRYLIIGQLVLMYWTTGLQKVSAYWTPGGDFSALYYIMQQPSWQRFDMTWVAWVYPFTQLATAVTWFWEVSCPLWLLAYWYRATRTRPGRVRSFFNQWDVRSIYAAVGILFHFIIFGTMNVGPFSPISLAFYAAVWHPDEWTRMARRLALRVAR